MRQSSHNKDLNQVHPVDNFVRNYTTKVIRGSTPESDSAEEQVADKYPDDTAQEIYYGLKNQNSLQN